MDIAIEDIRLYNPQMQGERFDVPQTKRHIYPQVKKLISKPAAIAIVGLRRVGKTILVKQLLNNCLKRNKEVFYFSFDEERYATIAKLDQIIKFALRTYEEPIIALDEIGRIDKWAGVIKKFVDAKGVKFILSGSRSLSVSKGKESLAGRLFDIYLPPLQFPEFVHFHGKIQQGIHLSLAHPERAFTSWEPTGLLDRFLSRGGFPELIHEDDRDYIRRYILANCIEKIIFEDLPKTFGITNEHALFSLWELIARNPSMTFVAINLEPVIGMTRDTITKYLFYLETAFLVKTIFREGSVQARMRKAKKVYPISPCISESVGGSDVSSGQIAETAVMDKLVNGLAKPVTFSRTKRKLEVDFVIDKIPIEVKYRVKLDAADYRNVFQYLNRNQQEIGIVVTKDTMDISQKGDVQILSIPLEMFLLLQDITR